jgi:hypothetical protein
MNIMLVTALHAAETLAVYHLQRADMTLGAAHDYHLDMARRCLDDIEHIKRQLADGGVTIENQDLVMRQRDVAAAQAVIGKHVLPEWRASEAAPRALEAMAGSGVAEHDRGPQMLVPSQAPAIGADAWEELVFVGLIVSDGAKTAPV